MAKLLRLEDSTGNLLFEADVSDHQLEEIGVMEEVISSVSGSANALADAVKGCVDILDPIFERASAASNELDAAEVEFGVSVSGEGNIYVVKLSGSANLKVKLNWKMAKNSAA